MQVGALQESLIRAKDYVLSCQRPDGSWSGSVESDPRPTAFYLFTVNNVGGAGDEAARMENYLFSTQLGCGAWRARPAGPPDVDVTLVCVLALENAVSSSGREARIRAQRWLAAQPIPQADSFWRGLLALNGDVPFSAIPYLSPRILSAPDWVHPNLYDFSFLRIAVVAASLLQVHAAETPSPQLCATSHSSAIDDEGFAEWKRRLVDRCRQPAAGAVSVICWIMRRVDQTFSAKAEAAAALRWLLSHQEEDGSFFSSVHMTSIAIITLHRLDPVGHARQVHAGLEAMRKWQRVRGSVRWQQFTDSTTWDTILFLDLLSALGVPDDHPQVLRARDYIEASQVTHFGDWSHRTRRAVGGAWGFQRVGRWYPDADDTAMALNALLNFHDRQSSEIIRRGLEWLLVMQSSSGGWASWDRDDRPWIALPGGGPWFARDLDAAEITARVVALFDRVLKAERPCFCDLNRPLERSIRRGLIWLRRNGRNGIWFGRWFTHYIYGTSQVLEAFRAIGGSQGVVVTRAAVEWLITLPNADGGFGESAEAASRAKFVGAPSTPFHTACGLSALTDADASFHPVAQRATTWLLRNQNPDGSWINEDFFAAGVPGLWYANFQFTPTYFAAKSLSKLEKALSCGREPRKANRG